MFAVKLGLKAHTPKKIIDVDPEKYKEMKAVRRIAVVFVSLLSVGSNKSSVNKIHSCVLPIVSRQFKISKGKNKACCGGYSYNGNGQL